MSDVSSFILKQFTNALDVEETTDEGVVVEGIAAEYEGKMYVRINGSDLLTPITSSVVGIKDGDFVKVRIKNHQASAEGNVTTPSTGGGGDVPDEVLDRITELEIAIIGKADIKDLEAEQARIDDLYAKNVTITGDLEAANAKIENLEAQNVTITGDLEAANAKIDDLEATKLDAEIADIKYATVENLEATNANIHNLEADYGDFKELTSDKITANEAAIKRLDTEKLSAKEAELKYANIDFANIGSAAIENFFSKSGMIGDLVVGDGTVTGTLVGVTIKGDLIEGGTVVADKLVIKGEDGLYYKLNTDGETVGSEQTEYNSLNGSIITAKSVTAEKISVNDLVAFDATIGGFNITESSIYSGVKESVDNTTRGIYMDDDGQFAIGDSNNYLKYFKMEDGTYKLALSVGGSSIDDAKATDKKSGYLVDIGPNAGKPPIDVVMYGDTKQNLWVNPASKTSSGITYTSNSDGSISISGTFESDSPELVFEAISYSLVPGRKYRLSANKELGGSSSQTYACVIQANESFPETSRHIVGSKGGQLYVEFTCSSSTTYIRMRLRIGKKDTVSVSNLRVMLTEAATAQTLPEIQGFISAIPDGGTAGLPQDRPVTLPAYPEELADSQAFDWVKPGINGAEPYAIHVGGQNIAPQKTLNKSSGIWNDFAEHKYIPERGFIMHIPLKKGDRIKFALWRNGKPYNGTNAALYIRDAGNSPLITLLPRSDNSTVTLTFDIDDGLYLYYYENGFLFEDITGADNTVRVAIYLNDDEVKWIPGAFVTPIDLKGRQLHMLPDGTRDELRIDDSGRITLVQRVGYVHVDGSESWSYGDGGVNRIKYKLEDDVYTQYGDEREVLCDTLLPRPSTGGADYFQYCAVSSTGYLYLKYAGANDLESHLAKLKANPLTVFYPIKKKEIILDSIAVSALQADYAYAWAASDIPAYMDVTYWTVAGKDVSDKINDAQNSANDANNKIDEQLPNIEYARSQIEILNKSIATLVVDENGGSLMTQTSDGWKFNIGGIQSTLDDAVHGIQDVKGDMAGIEELANQTNALANDVAKKTAYINMTQDESGAPVMELGQQGGEFKLRITNTSMDFMQGSQRIAYLSNRQLYIQSSVVTDEMKIGATSGYIWKKRANGNMGLRYVTE